MVVKRSSARQRASRGRRASTTGAIANDGKCEGGRTTGCLDNGFSRVVLVISRQPTESSHVDCPCFSSILLVCLLLSLWHLACSPFPLRCLFDFSLLSALAGLRAASQAAAGIAGRTGPAPSGGLAVAASGGNGTGLASRRPQTGTETCRLTRRRTSGRGGFFLPGAAPRSESAPSGPIMKITVAKNGLLGYTIQDRPRLLAAARRAMREHLKLGKSFTRQTAESQERAIKELEAAEPPLTRCIGSWGACSLLSRALANSKLEGGDDEDATAEAVQGQVHGAVSGRVTRDADVPLHGGGGSGACASCCGRGLCGPSQAAGGDETQDRRGRGRSGRRRGAGGEDVATASVQRQLDNLAQLD